jgi:hypothetical protein
MKKLLLIAFLGLGFMETQAQARDLNINVTTLNDVVKGKWILTNVNPAGAAPFQEFNIKGPGFGEVGKLRDNNKIEQIISKIILGNGNISFSDADGDRVNLQVTQLSKTSLKLTSGSITMLFSKN